MKVWPIDPLVPRNLRLEVPEKLPQGLTTVTSTLGPRAALLYKTIHHGLWPGSEKAQHPGGDP